jgi:hypothetical protein
MKSVWMKILIIALVGVASSSWSCVCVDIDETPASEEYNDEWGQIDDDTADDDTADDDTMTDDDTGDDDTAVDDDTSDDDLADDDTADDDTSDDEFVD